MALVLISGIFQAILSDRYHSVDACLMLFYDINYGGKKTRDPGLTCRSHLSNIMPDTIFYDSMGWGNGEKLLLFFFCKGDNYCLPQHRRDGLSLIIITLMDLATPCAITD